MSAPNSPAPDPLRAESRSVLRIVATRPVAITMFMVALGVFGAVSFLKLPLDLLPEISYPTLTVRTAYPGAAPADVEDRVSMRLQEALATLPNLVRTTSISRAGFSDVLLEFDWGTGMTFAVQDVRDRVDGVFLPAGTERPLILRYDPNLDPILRLGVRPTGSAEDEHTLIQLRWLAEKRIERELEGLEGVAAIQVRGGLEEEILVRVDPFKLEAQGLDPAQIAQRLSQENLNASGGQIREGSTDYLVRTLNEFQTVEEIEDLAITRRGEAAIRLRDVASVARTHAEREVITRLEGAEAVEVAIYREAGANIVDVSRRVREAIFGTAEQQKQAEGVRSSGRGGGGESWQERQNLGFLAWVLREEAQLEVLSDQSTFIAEAVKDVQMAAIAGGVLAVLVILAFLRRLVPTAIIAVAIPISILVTFAPMYLLDVSLNIMSLGGLALGVGMLVDNAIVVLESITRCREEGDDRVQAAVRGVQEVAGAITASTLTTVAVFAPIVFVHGIAGQIFGDQAVTVVSSLLVSLLVAVLFIPMLAAIAPTEGLRQPTGVDAQSPDRPRGLSALLREWFPADLHWSWNSFVPNLLLILGRCILFGSFLLGRAGFLLLGGLYRLLGWIAWPLRKLFDGFWTISETIYPRLLAGAVAHPLIVLLLAAGLTWGAVHRFQTLGAELLPEIHQGEFTAHVGLEVGTALEHSDQVYTNIEREVRALEGVAITALTVGVEQDTLTREIEGEHTCRLTVRLTPEASGPASEEGTLEHVRSLLEAHPEVRSIDFTRPTPFALDSPIAVEVLGWELEQLNEVAEEVRQRMLAIEGLTDVRTTVRPGHPEARVTFDRDKTLEYDLDLGAVSNLLRDQVLGNVGTRFVEGEERIDIRVKADEAVLASLSDVLDLAVNPGAENSVPLRAVADVEVVRGPAEIRRIGNSRAVVVTAASTGLDLGGIAKRIEQSLSNLVTPKEVTVELGGQKREMDEGLASLRFALLLAIFLVYVVMASQFESLMQPFVILFSLPLAAVGVIFALDILSTRLSVVVFIGLILLAGIVVNNAIVLVDRINQRRAAGLELNAAILEAGRARLRPILMTTATTVLGLLPLTGWLTSIPVVGGLGAGEGAELRAPMAITVIAGLTSSTLLTLVVIPVIYSLVARLASKKTPQVTQPVTHPGTQGS